MYKFIFLMLLIFIHSLCFSQEAKVGINTSAPTRTLDVNGALRVRAMTDKSNNNDYKQLMVASDEGYVDVASKSSIVPNEPWNIVGTQIGADANTQNIYQNANVGVGNFHNAPLTSKLEILGGGNSQLGLSESALGSKWTISSAPHGLVFSSVKPNDGGKIIFQNDGSVSINELGLNTSDKGDFFYDASHKKLNLGKTPNSEAKLSINPDVNQEILKLYNMKNLTENTQDLNGADANYYDLKISEEGFVRKLKPTAEELTQSKLCDLETTYYSRLLLSLPDSQSVFAEADKMMFKYSTPGGTSEVSREVLLPEDGSYVFSFRLYGRLYTRNVITAPLHNNKILRYYLYALKNSITFDLIELNIINTSTNEAILYGQASYNVFLTISGKKGDKVSFALTGWLSDNITWRLIGSPGLNARKTSMLFWKL